jgi:hypothetical protein
MPFYNVFSREKLHAIVSWLGVSWGKAHTNFKLNTMITNTHPSIEQTSNPNCAKPLLAAAAVI